MKKGFEICVYEKNFICTEVSILWILLNLRFQDPKKKNLVEKVKNKGCHGDDAASPGLKEQDD